MTNRKKLKENFVAFFKKEGLLLGVLLLSTIAMTFTGVLSTVWFYDETYNGQTFLKENNSDSLLIEKKYNVFSKSGDATGTTAEKAFISRDDIKNLNNNDLGLEFTGVYSYGDYGMYDFYENVANYYNYLCTYFRGFSDCGEEYILRNGFTKIAGHYPTNEKEIAISEGTLNVFKAGKYCDARDYYNPIEIKSAEDIVGRKIKVRMSNKDDYTIELAISGVYKFDDFEHYVANNKDPLRELKFNKYKKLYDSSFNCLGYISKAFVERYKSYLIADSFQEVELKTGYFSNNYVLHQSDYEKFKRNNKLTKYPYGQYVSGSSYFKEQSDKFIVTDISGNKLSSVPTLEKNDVLVHFYSDETYLCMKQLAEQSLKNFYYVADRNGDISPIGGTYEKLKPTVFYYNESTKDVSLEPKTNYSRVDYLIYSDDGQVAAYYKDGLLYSSLDNATKIVKYVDLSTFYYDRASKKVLTKYETYTESNGVAYASSDKRPVETINLYTLDANGEPNVKYGNEIPKMGLFVNKNTGEYSFTKTNDDFIFTTEYWCDENGKIIFGTKVDLLYERNGEKFYTPNLVPLGYTKNIKFAYLTGYLTDKSEVIKAIKRYCNFYRESCEFLESYADFDNLVVEEGFDENDIKTIITAYNNYLTEFNNPENISFLDHLAFYSEAERKATELQIKGFFISDSSKECKFTNVNQVILNDDWITDWYFYHLATPEKASIESTNYNYNILREYRYAIAKSNFNDDQIKYAYKANNDDSFYKPKSSTFDSYVNTGKTDADDMLVGLLVILSFAFVYCCIAIPFEVKRQKENIYSNKGSKVSFIYKFLYALVPVVLTALVVSGLSSLLSLAFVSGWNNGLKEEIITTTLCFSFTNFLFLFGMATLIIGVPTLISCLFVKIRNGAKH